MSEQKVAHQVEGMLNCVRHPVKLQDICVQKVFAFDFEAFPSFSFFRFPSVICNCIVENVEVTSRNIFFNCDNVLLCIEYNICLKLFPKVGAPVCQTFQACFTKVVELDDFKDESGCPISPEEFQTAEGACVIAFPFFADCFVFDNEVCNTELATFVAFFIVVKLWRERNVLVFAVPFLEDFPTEKLPKVVNSCGLPNLAVNGNSAACANARSSDYMEKLPAAKKGQLEKALAEKKEEFANKFNEIKKMMGK